MARLAVAAGIAGVLTAGAAPALADNAISKYSGNASGQAIALQVNPDAVLDVRLSAVQQIINQLDSVKPGLTGSVNNTIGSTLANPTAPINVAVDQASAKGVSTDGLKLSDGSASSTAVAIDAKSLASEVALINQAVHNMPSGTVDALRTALAPLAAHDPTLAAALNDYLPELAAPVTGSLGSPTVDLLKSVNANFGQDVQGDITTVGTGVLTPESALKLQPFEARALPSDAYASNAVDNLALVPSGRLGLVSPQQLSMALAAIDKALIAAEDVVTKAASGTPLGSVIDPITGTAFPVINSTVATAGTTVQGIDVSKVNALISSITSTLSGLDGLQLNDIVGNNGANSLSSINRAGDVVTASGLGEVAHVDVVKINDATLKGLLNADELASVDGIKATADVSLDGVHAAKQSANGTLVDVKILGKSLSSYVPASLGTVSLDQILPAGSTCTINIPGVSTCHGIQLVDPVTSLPQLAQIQGTIGQAVPTLLSVTLTRGAQVVDQTNSVNYGRADITVLQVTSDVNCAAVSKVSNALASVQSSLASALNLHLAACGLGVTNSPTSPNAAGTPHLLNASFGVAHAELGLDTSHGQPNTPDTTTPGVTPPNTGNDLLILAGFAVAAMAAGIALQVRRVRA